MGGSRTDPLPVLEKKTPAKLDFFSGLWSCMAHPSFGPPWIVGKMLSEWIHWIDGEACQASIYIFFAVIGRTPDWSLPKRSGNVVGQCSPIVFIHHQRQLNTGVQILRPDIRRRHSQAYCNLLRCCDGGRASLTIPVAFRKRGRPLDATSGFLQPATTGPSTRIWRYGAFPLLIPGVDWLAGWLIVLPWEITFFDLVGNRKVEDIPPPIGPQLPHFPGPGGLRLVPNQLIDWHLRLRANKSADDK